MPLEFEVRDPLATTEGGAPRKGSCAGGPPAPGGEDRERDIKGERDESSGSDRRRYSTVWPAILSQGSPVWQSVAPQ